MGFKLLIENNLINICCRTPT